MTSNLIPSISHKGDLVSTGIDFEQVNELFRRFPGATFYWIRDLVGRFYGLHQREWRRRRQVTFREGGMREQVQGERFLRGRRGGSFLYKVFPENKRPSSPDLRQIRGEAYTESVPALGLETGGAFRARSGGSLAIPIGITKDSLGRTKSAYTARRNTKAGAFESGVRRFARTHQTVVLPSKNDRNVRVIYWRRNLARMGGAKQHGPKRKGYELVPAFLLVKGVLRRARLRYIQTWHELDAERRARYQEALQSILQEVTGGA